MYYVLLSRLKVHADDITESREILTHVFRVTYLNLIRPEVKVILGHVCVKKSHNSSSLRL